MSTYSLLMAQRGRRGVSAQPGRAPQLIVWICCVVVGFTGLWLWWLSDSPTTSAANSRGFLEPLTLQLWMRRVHVVAAIILMVVIVGLLAHAAATADGWRAIFLAMFIFLAVIGMITGLNADWSAGRIWASTVGSRSAAFVPLDGRVLPDSLREIRVHLAIIPASLLLVAGGSYWYSRR